MEEKRSLYSIYKEVIPVTGSGGPQGCETSGITDGGEAASLTHRPAPPRRTYWYSFLLEAEQTSRL
jgi:hypothetical protein